MQNNMTSLSLLRVTSEILWQYARRIITAQQKNDMLAEINRAYTPELPAPWWVGDK